MTNESLHAAEYRSGVEKYDFGCMQGLKSETPLHLVFFLLSFISYTLSTMFIEY